MNRRNREDGRMSLRDYAKRIGVSHVAVVKAIQQGRLLRSVTYDAKERPRIDPTLADQEWERNTDTDHDRSGGAGGRTPRQASMFEGEGAGGGGGGDGSGPAGFQGKSLTQWRAAQIALAARNEQLDLEERQGKLVAVEKVRAEWFALVRSVRERLLLIPDRISGPVAAESNQALVRKIIDAEIRSALQELTADEG